MRKKLLAAVIAGAMAMAFAMPVLAGEWKQSEAGWWYQNDDGSYPSSGWTWVNGKCYYFTPEGYCLMDTQTPDGYTVDASGAWVIDGVVQTQEVSQSEGTQASAAGVTVAMDNMTFTIPDGFEQDFSRKGGIYLFNKSQQVAIAYASEEIPELGGNQGVVDSMQQDILDGSMEIVVGSPTGKDSRQFGTGVWYRYDYADASYFGIPGSMNYYVRISGTKLQMLVFAGYISEMDTDAIMNNNLRY